MWPLLVFALLLSGWSGLLWLLFPSVLGGRSLPALVLLHLAPPIVTLILAALIVQLKRDTARRREDARLQAAQAQREADRLQQRERHQQQLRERRRGIDVRWAGIADGYLSTGRARIIDDSLHTTTLRSDSNARRADDAWPERALTLLMGELFSHWPVAATLPVVWVPPDNLALRDAMQNVEQARLAALAGRPAGAGASSVEVVELRAGAAAAHSELSALFEAHPDWPGALLVAFDCHPGYMHIDAQDRADGPADKAARLWHGAPNRGLSLLLATPPGLDVALHQLRENDGFSNDMQAPFWERNPFPVGIAHTLAPLPASLRETMPPAVAAIHRAHHATFDQQATPSMRVESTRDLIREAGIDAGLIDLPFIYDGEADPEQTAAPPLISQCGWLVHNAGEISCGGDRLAQLSSALYQHSIELNPINAATNTVPTFGNCGSASSWLLLTHALQRVATLRKPVICALFDGKEMAAHFLIPADPALEKPGHIDPTGNA